MREDRLYSTALNTGETTLITTTSNGYRPPIWSSDGKKSATGTSNTVYTQPGLVIDVERGMVAKMRWAHLWGGFRYWTADSRYAIFSSSDQYGNGMTSVFDVGQWKMIIGSTGSGCIDAHDFYGSCQADVIATSPVSPVILLESGESILIPARILSASSIVLSDAVVANAAGHQVEFC